MSRPKRQYSDEQRAAALAALDANGGNVLKTAKEEGIPANTLDEWRKGRHPACVPNIRERMNGNLADALEEIAWKCMEEWPRAIKEASAGQIGTSVTVCVEKMRLLREQATAIQENREQDLTPDERADRINALLDRSRDRRGKAVPDGPGAVGAGPPPDLLH